MLCFYFSVVTNLPPLASDDGPTMKRSRTLKNNSHTVERNYRVWERLANLVNSLSFTNGVCVCCTYQYFPYPYYILQALTLITSYRTVQNFDGENIDKFNKFPAIRQYFPYQTFHLVSYLLLMNLWQSGSTRNKIMSEAPSLGNHNIQSSLSHYTTIL